MDLTQEISNLKAKLEENEEGGDAKQAKIQEL
jgi:hypothetical protein